jgi:hypothetical protein
MSSEMPEWAKNFKRCCTTAPRSMLGMSWWKNLGFNSPCSCTEQLYAAGCRYRSDYLNLAAFGDEYGASFVIQDPEDWKANPEWIKLWKGDAE